MQDGQPVPLRLASCPTCPQCLAPLCTWSPPMTMPRIEMTKKDGARLDKAIRAFRAGGQTLGDLTKAVAKIFGPERADEIATTEVTRACAEEVRTTAEEAKAKGWRMLEIWQTNNDADVCEKCAPLNGTQRGEDWEEYPPLHSNCRCRVGLEMV